MRLIGSVPANWTLSNLYREASNLNHHVRGHLDLVGVECLENLEIFFPAPADIGGDDGEFSTGSLAYKSRSR